MPNVGRHYAKASEKYSSQPLSRPYKPPSRMFQIYFTIQAPLVRLPYLPLSYGTHPSTGRWRPTGAIDQPACHFSTIFIQPTAQLAISTAKDAFSNYCRSCPGCGGIRTVQQRCIWRFLFGVLAVFRRVFRELRCAEWRLQFWRWIWCWRLFCTANRFSGNGTLCSGLPRRATAMDPL